MQAEAARNCFAFLELFLQILCMLFFNFFLEKKTLSKIQFILHKNSHRVQHDAKVLPWKASFASFCI